MDERHKCRHSGKDEVRGGEGWKGRKSDFKKNGWAFFYWLKDMGQKFGHIILCIFMFTTFFALYKDNEDIKYEQNRQSDAAKKNIN